jgi:E3 Ubiquitin ligase
MFCVMLMYVGGMLVISGFVAAHLHRAEGRLARRAPHLPPRRAGDLVGTAEALVRVDGKVVAEDGGCLIAPCSGKPAAWFRVRLLQRLASRSGGIGSGGSLWATLTNEVASAKFLIEDGSGERIRVNPEEISVAIETTAFRSLSPEALERLQKFLSQRGTSNFIADLYEEECLQPGDSVIAVGCIEREAGVAVAKEYRDVPSSSLVMRAFPNEQVIVGTAASLGRQRGGAYLAGQIAMIAGASAMVTGLVIRLLLP